MTAEEVLERWDDLGKDLEMGSSDEMSDDDQCSGLKNLTIWMIQMSQSCMECSDDKFSDLEEVEEDEQDDTPFPTASSPCSSEVYTSPLSITSPSTIPGWTKRW